MTLASSGSISVAAIAAEVGGFPFSIPSTPIRNLTGRPSGNIIMPTHFYGQTGGGSCTEQGTSTGQTVAGVATIAGVSIGNEAWNRVVTLAVHWACSTSDVETTCTAVTIGGIAGTVHVSNGEGGTAALTNHGCAIVSAIVPTGTTATVVLAFSNSTVRNVLVTAYRVTGRVSAGAFNNANAFDEDLSSPSATSAQALLDIPSSGLAFFAATGSSGGVHGAMSTTGITEQQENSLVPEGRTSSGFQTGLGAQTNRPITTSWSTSSGVGRLRLATSSFQLA